jgi:anti-sigma B factor antagonist
VLFEIDAASDVTVVRCSGRIVQGDGRDDLVDAVMSQDCPHIQIDLRRVTAIDASGLGALVALERWARDGDRKLELINPSKRVRQTLEATKLNSVLHITPSQGRGQAA